MNINLEKIVEEFFESFNYDEKFVSKRNFDLFKNQGGHFWSNDWESFKNDESILIPLDEVKKEHLEYLQSLMEELEEDEKTEENISDYLNRYWDNDEDILAVSILEERYYDFLKEFKESLNDE